MERFIDVDEVIANACTLIEEVNDELTLVMRQWVWMALRSIGPSRANIGVASINIIDGSAKKPKDLIGNIIDLTIQDYDGNDLSYRYNYDDGNIHSNSSAKKSRVSLDIYEDDHYIHLADFDPKPGKVTIKYYKMPLDECGLPLVPEDHLNAIVAYILYMYYLRKGNNYAMIGMCKNDWSIERDRIKSRNKSISGIRAKQALREWMSLIPNQRYDRR